MHTYLFNRDTLDRQRRFKYKLISDILYAIVEYLNVQTILVGASSRVRYAIYTDRLQRYAAPECCRRSLFGHGGVRPGAIN